MANLFSSIIFGVRNVDKSLNDNVARTPVAIGQATNVVNEIAKMNNKATMLLKSADNGSKAIKYIKTGAKFAAEHINPLICAAGAYKVIKADDKEKEFVNQTASLGAMFCAEKAYKTIVDYKNIKKVSEVLGQSQKLEKLLNSSFVKNLTEKIGDKKLKFALNSLYGLGFVVTSINGYNLGEKFAQKATNSTKIKNQQAQLAQMQQITAIPQPVYTTDA